MPVVHATIRIAPDGTISGKAPPEVPAGEYDAPLRLPERRPKRKALDLPQHEEPWDDTVSLRRQDIYGDDGR